MDTKNIGRNDPCPCGSGKKYKKCHMGHEDALIFEMAQSNIGQKIAALPPAEHPRAQELNDKLDIQELTGKEVRIKFIDLDAYESLQQPDEQNEVFPISLKNMGAGLLVNPLKTQQHDPDHLYIAITPNVNDSTLVHELAHALDDLTQEPFVPGVLQHLALEAEAPIEHLEHTMEFGHWLELLLDRFPEVTLDAEDQIVYYLYKEGQLLTREEVASKDIAKISQRSRELLRYMKEHSQDIHAQIHKRTGYLGQLGDQIASLANPKDN